MQIKSIFLSVGILGVGQVVAADQLFNNHSFAVIESSVAFCALVDPTSAARYQDKVKHFAAGKSEDQLTEARNSPEYKAAFKSASAAFEGLSKEQAQSTCASLLKGGK